jgi:hypothetical protein
MARDLPPVPPLQDIAVPSGVWPRWFMLLRELVRASALGLTSLSGIIKGAGGVFAVASPNVDYALPPKLQYAAPADGFTLALPAGTTQVLLEPAADLTSGTVMLPVGMYDGQQCWITMVTFHIATLTVVAASGQSVVPPATRTLHSGSAYDAIPSTLWVFRLGNASWYRVL